METQGVCEENMVLFVPVRPSSPRLAPQQMGKKRWAQHLNSRTEGGTARQEAGSGDSAIM